MESVSCGLSIAFALTTCNVDTPLAVVQDVMVAGRKEQLSGMVAGTASSAEWEIPSIMALMYQQPGLWSLLTLGKKKVFQPAMGAESRRVHDELLVDSAAGQCA